MLNDYRCFNNEEYKKVVRIIGSEILTKDNADTAIPWNLENYFKGRAAGDFRYELDYFANLMDR